MDQAFYERTCRMVYRICYPYFGNPADTEDAVQETYMRYLRTEPKLIDAQHEKAWLIRTARHVCLDELKRKRRSELPLTAVRENAPEPDNPLMEALSQLPEKYRIALYLYYYEGYRTGEIAKLLRLPAATVRSQIARGRKLLRSQMEDMT